MKICNKCHFERPVDNFPPGSNECKPCCNERKMRYKMQKRCRELHRLISWPAPNRPAR